jgi:predicted nuclease of predicted toxin-antitoxin system
MGGNRRKSTKPSGTKAELLLKSSTFFVDYCLGKKLGNELRETGLNVEFHSEHFKDDADDPAWISEVGRRGWIILTKDKAIQRIPAELQAVKAAKVRMFSLPSGNMTGEEMAKLFIKSLSLMARFLKDHPAPFIARLTQSGVKLVYPRKPEP